MTISTRAFSLLSALVVTGALLTASASALAAPAWRIDALANSTAAPGGTLDYLVEVRNAGNADLEGTAEPITFSGTLPAGLTILGVSTSGLGTWDCSSLVAGAQTFSCRDTSDVFTTPAETSFGYFQVLLVKVAADPAASGILTGRFSIEGGDASDGDPTTPSASTVAPATITDAAPAFGLASFDTQVTADAAGTPSTQAGAHPFEATTSIDFNTFRSPAPLKGDLTPVEAVKDLDVDLPAGFFGDPHNLGQCTLSQLANARLVSVRALCPPSSQVGTTVARVNGVHMLLGPIPVFNMVPPLNAPARLGFNVLGTVVTLDVSPRSTTDYGLTAHLRDISEGLGIAGASLTLWGVPADPVHDAERACPGQVAPWENGPTCQDGGALAAFLRNPTSCAPPGIGLPTTVRADSWVHPGRYVERSISSHLPNGYPSPESEWGPQIGTTGCGKVPFNPSFTATPGSATAGQPAGFDFHLDLPQSDEPESIGEGDLRKAVVTLPAGVKLSPSAAQGLGSCSPAQIALHSQDAAACPDSSKLGTVTVTTPALKEPLTGHLYLATPHENPFGTLVAIYLVAEGSGVRIKLAGRVDLDPATGQITTTFDDNPQLPFSDLHLAFDGGPRAPLTLPSRCGTYTTHALLTSWSGKTVEQASSFQVTEGPAGGPCAAPSFGPSFSAGTTSPIAGGFSPFAMRLLRGDGDEPFGTLTRLKLPSGLLADVASVPVRCTDAQAAAAACPAASRVGSVTTGAGSGPAPFYTSGDVYLMGKQTEGPFAGDPFGLAIVVHAVAGPFDLGYVLVRAGTQINDDGSITTVSEPFPQILQGIPLQLKDVRISLDRPNFIFNPTDCNPLRIAGSLTSTAGATAALSSRFQSLECANLKFKPSFRATTLANGTFNRGGASLDVKIAAPGQGPGAPVGSREANIARVETQLPKVLPSRLTTLQKACTEKQFAANPAGCPPASFVGTAVARTPILSSPLEGPAVLVSHGGRAFPDLVLVLQGEGITLDVTGHTDIKHGTTFSRFETVPDAPISSFELKLPEGRFSVLAAAEELCGHNVKSHGKVKHLGPSLAMPTRITAQDGAVEELKPKVALKGCPKARTARTARKKGKGAHR
jgi:uncharacterized repeat protein (TIGR01451 family)